MKVDEAERTDHHAQSSDGAEMQLAQTRCRYGTARQPVVHSAGADGGRTVFSRAIPLRSRIRLTRDGYYVKTGCS